jgi:hypothetical protein
VGRNARSGEGAREGGLPPRPRSPTGTDPGRENAVIALNASTGQIVWVNQLVSGDIWNGNIVPSAANPDADLADTPKIFQLADGTKVVSAGSKDDFYLVMNAPPARRSTARTGRSSK